MSTFPPGTIFRTWGRTGLVLTAMPQKARKIYWIEDSGLAPGGCPWIGCWMLCDLQILSIWFHEPPTETK